MVAAAAVAAAADERRRPRAAGVREAPAGGRDASPGREELRIQTTTITTKKIQKSDIHRGDKVPPTGLT